MMNRAVSTPQGHQPGAMEQVSYLTSLERTQPTMTQIPATAQPRIEVKTLLKIQITLSIIDESRISNSHHNVQFTEAGGSCANSVADTPGLQGFGAEKMRRTGYTLHANSKSISGG